MRIAIFASGNGSNFQAITEAIKSNKINGTIMFLFCDNPNALVIQRAQRLGISTIIFSPKDFSSKREYEEKLLKKLNEEDIQLIVLAGYMRIIGSSLLQAFPNQIINIHPSLLPKFPGLHGIRDAFNAKAKETGVTIHYVDDGVDTGPIIRQEKILIDKKETLETLEAKIHQVEHRLYPEVLAEIINDKERALHDKKTSTN